MFVIFNVFNFKSSNQKNIINSNLKRFSNQVYRLMLEEDLPKKV